MLKKSLIALVAIVIAAPTFAANYEVDAAHSSVKFTIRHLVSKVSGSFADFAGKFEFDDKNPAAAKGEFVAKAASIDTNNAKRDEHLRSPDFFNVAKFPDIKLKAKKLAMNGKTGKLEADFTMLGVTKPVTFDVEYLGSAKSPMGGDVAGFTGTGTINRKDFGMVWNKALDAGGIILGDEVQLELQLEAAKK